MVCNSAAGSHRAVTVSASGPYFSQTASEMQPNDNEKIGNDNIDGIE